jgi:hypothetical protein
MSPCFYWLGANVFIQARNGPYSFTLVPQFWTFLSEQLNNGMIKCPKMVYDEIINGKDDLAAWFKPRRGMGLCRHSDETVQQCYSTVVNYVAATYKPHQAAEFMIGADGWLIAHAMDGDGIVVTQESNRSHKAKIKIPTVCKVFGVRCINTYEMLNALKANLGAPQTAVLPHDRA